MENKNYLPSTEFSLKNSICYVKLDGSLINCYNDGDQWNISTRKMAFAEGETDKGNTFKEVVEKVTGDINDFLSDVIEELHDFTIIGELTSPETRIVIPYPETKLYVLAIRNKFTGECLPQKEVESFTDKKKIQGYNVDTPDYYKFNTFDEIINTATKLDPMSEDGEGYVCYDTVTQNRIKIKNPSYLQLSHLRENGAISNKRIAVLVFDQEYEEYLSIFECDREFFKPYIEAYNKMIKNIKETYEKYENIINQKDFALQIKDMPISSILFNLRKGLTLKECFSELNDQKKHKLLEKYKN